MVSDTCAISNLRNGELLDLAFGLPFQFAVPDLLVHEELDPAEYAHLAALGIEVVELTAPMVAVALGHRAARGKLSMVDCFALTLAGEHDWCLLTDDGLLRQTAVEFNVEMHGTLWLVEQMAVHQVCGSDVLCTGVERMASHPTARLPKNSVSTLLAALRAGQF